ncbi:MAG: hypothetical protein IJS14_10405 [Lentisphaeria bacterium]|nr:hypothetical protein [Lentisphaeria bacterium]
MKKLICASLCLLAAASVFGAECRKNTNAYVAPTERGVPWLLKNNLTNYVVTYRYTNPSPTQAGEVLLGMPMPVNVTGFSRKNFTSLVINGIDSRVLEPKKFEPFNNGQEAGVDVYYNFDGIPMIQRFWVSDSSPLLNMTWRRGPGTPFQPIRSMSVRIVALPCAAGRAKGSYSREIVTPAAKYVSKGRSRRQKEQKLTARDTVLILQDAKYQSGPQSTNTAPVVLCPDWKGILSGTASFGSSQEVYLFFELKPDAESWSFGFLDSEVRRSNADFMAFLKKVGVIR